MYGLRHPKRGCGSLRWQRVRRAGGVGAAAIVLFTASCTSVSGSAVDTTSELPTAGAAPTEASDGAVTGVQSEPTQAPDAGDTPIAGETSSPTDAPAATTPPQNTTQPQSTTPVDPPATAAPTTAPVDETACSPTEAVQGSGEVIVAGIAVDDPDLGLVLHDGPGVSTPVQGPLTPGTKMFAGGGCAKAPDGSVWWEVEDGHFLGWVAANYLSTEIPNANCPSDIGGIPRFGRPELLADFDGDGAADALYLIDAGEVNPGEPWYAWIQFADGGRSSMFDPRSVSPDFADRERPDLWSPSRVDVSNSTRSVAVLTYEFEGAAAAGGNVYFLGVNGCDPTVLLEAPYHASVGTPQWPYLCPDGNGRSTVRVVDGLDEQFHYRVTPYDFVDNRFVAQDPIDGGSPEDGPDASCS